MWCVPAGFGVRRRGGERRARARVASRCIVLGSMSGTTKEQLRIPQRPISPIHRRCVFTAAAVLDLQARWSSSPSSRPRPASARSTHSTWSWRRRARSRLAPRLWRLPRDLDTPPPSVAALLQPLARSTTLPGLLDGLSESPPPPTLRPWRLHFEAHAAAPSAAGARERPAVRGGAAAALAAALVDGDAAAELHLVRTRRLWYLCAGRAPRRAPPPTRGRAALLVQRRRSHHLAALAVSVAASASPVAPRRLLDPCCGSGTVLHAAALRGLRATGVDLNAATVEGAAAGLAACAPAGGYAFAPRWRSATRGGGGAARRRRPRRRLAAVGAQRAAPRRARAGRPARERCRRGAGGDLRLRLGGAAHRGAGARGPRRRARVVPVNANAKHSSVLTVARVGGGRSAGGGGGGASLATAEILEGGGLKGEAADDVAAFSAPGGASPCRCAQPTAARGWRRASCTRRRSTAAARD